MSEQSAPLGRYAELEQDVAILTVIMCITAAALDRPVRVGERRPTWTETMLRAIDGAKEGGYQARILDVMRTALEVGSEPPSGPDGGSRVVELLRKAA